MNPPDPIPVTPLHKLYCEARGIGQKRRLELAQTYVDCPADLESIYRDSVIAYESGYTNAKEEAFSPPHQPLPGFCEPKIGSGRHLAQILAHPAGRVWKIDGAGSDLAFKFVDYEVPPLRTTSLRTTGSARWEGKGDRRSRGPVADLLLVAADGTPVVGEVKAVTETHFDTDHVMALIQGLLLTAAFASPQQRRRLSSCYPDAGFASSGPLGLYVIVVDPKNPPARSLYQAKLTAAATELIDKLRKQPSIKRTLKQIEFVYARWNGSRLHLSVKKH